MAWRGETAQTKKNNKEIRIPQVKQLHNARDRKKAGIPKFPFHFHLLCPREYSSDSIN